ncbi:hypothetical protein QQ73_05290, partial [Candidatus Endoriftia persephone str. Guaymas]|nr:hypothetical protein [Candidatus Endoriftia persephone str. Guaymas]
VQRHLSQEQFAGSLRRRNKHIAMNQYPLWKNLLVVIVILVGALYALPNIYDQDPSMEISGTRRAQIDATTPLRINTVLAAAQITAKAIEPLEGKLLVR